MTGRGLGALIVGLAVLVAAGCGQSDRSGAPAGERADTGRSSTSQAPPAAPRVEEVRSASRAPSVVVAEEPGLTRLPSGAVVRVRAVGTTPAGQLAVPRDIASAGWWRGGSRLGDPFGSTLIAAHVDSSSQGLGPFAELLEVGRGARITVSSPSLRQEFAVASRRLVAQGSLADDSWIYAVSGPRRLTLVTCAPPFVASRGRLPEPRRDRRLPDRPDRTPEAVMAGKKKPPRPLRETPPVRSKEKARRPAESAIKPDEQLRDRLDAALAAAIVGARVREEAPPTASAASSADLRTRLQAALGVAAPAPPASEPPAPEPPALERRRRAAAEPRSESSRPRPRPARPTRPGPRRPAGGRPPADRQHRRRHHPVDRQRAGSTGPTVDDQRAAGRAGPGADRELVRRHHGAARRVGVGLALGASAHEGL